MRVGEVVRLCRIGWAVGRSLGCDEANAAVVRRIGCTGRDSGLFRLWELVVEIQCLLRR